MAENTETVRKDSATRELEGKQRQNWGGKRVVLPHGTTLPPIATAEPNEVFILNRAHPLRDQMYIFDSEYNNWSTVGPG